MFIISLQNFVHHYNKIKKYSKTPTPESGSFRLSKKLTTRSLKQMALDKTSDDTKFKKTTTGYSNTFS